ncbi:MAG: hypothetical protein ACK5NG_11700 [Chthoniobacterales bacterium]
MKYSILTILILGSVLPLHAEPVIYEPFDGPSGESVTESRDGIGFDKNHKGNNWNNTTGLRGTANLHRDGLAFPGLQTKGNALLLDFSNNAGNETLEVSAVFTDGLPEDQPVWVSFLCQLHGVDDDDVANNATAFLRILSPQAEIKFRCGISDKTTQIRHSGELSNEGRSRKFSLKAEKTYLLVARFPSAEESDRDCELWLLDSQLPEGIASQDASTIEAQLKRAAVSTASATATGAVIEAGDQLVIGLWGRHDTTFSSLIDEIRIGSTPQDVLPPK